MGYTDNDLMPFGKYSDRKLANVPASYLLWLNDQPSGIWHKELNEYVQDNIEVLRHQAAQESYNAK